MIAASLPYVMLAVSAIRLVSVVQPVAAARKGRLEGPREGECLVEIKATGICHTDEFTRSGGDPEGLFPSILGHEGAGVVVETG